MESRFRDVSRRNCVALFTGSLLAPRYPQNYPRPGRALYVCMYYVEQVYAAQLTMISHLSAHGHARNYSLLRSVYAYGAIIVYLAAPPFEVVPLIYFRVNLIMVVSNA